MRNRLLPVIALIIAGGLTNAAVAATLSVPSGAYKTIQSAVNAAQPGDTIYINPKPNGLPYNEYVTVPVAKPDLQLIGVNNPVLDGTGLGTTDPTLPGFIIGNNGITVRATGVTVAGLTVKNFQYTIPNGILIPSAGIYVEGATSGVFVNNSLIDNYIGLHIQGLNSSIIPQEFTIKGNMLSGNLNAGALITGTDGTLIVEENTASGNGQAGIVLNAAHGSRVLNNVLSGNGSAYPAGSLEGAGLYISFAGGDITGNSIIQGNRIYENAGAGILVYGSTGQTLDNNTLTANGAGIRIELSAGLTVQDNLVTASLYDGITLTTLTTDCLVTGNTSNNNGGVGFGVLDGYSINNIITGNHAHDNTPYDALQVCLNGQAVKNTWSDNDFGTGEPKRILK